MRYFCSYFDHHFIPRGLALAASLRAQGGPFRLFVLCLDDLCYDALMRAGPPEIVPIALPHLEAYDPDLRPARARRSLIEYYFTLSPAFPLYLLEAFPEIDIITYLDSDLFFFGDPETVFSELGSGSIGIISHRFPEAAKFREKYGVYNVGWVSWRRDETGIACLEWYRERCLEWCFDNANGKQFADQKYLDDWPVRFPNVRTIEHKGCNLAPWNIEAFKYTVRDGRLFVDEDPIIFYHFHQLKNATQPTWESTSIDTYLTGPRTFDPNILMNSLYLPYAKAMQTAQKDAEDLRIQSAPRVELRHASVLPSGLNTLPWRWHLDWRTEGGEAAVQTRADRPLPATPLPRPASDGQLAWAGEVGDMIRERLEQEADGAPLHILDETAFERADWDRTVNTVFESGVPVLIHGVRTFTATETSRVMRRPLGDPSHAPFHVVQRAALGVLAGIHGYRLQRELVWPESVAIDQMPERADRRSMLFIPA